jgi:hypothetical protein
MVLKNEFFACMGIRYRNRDIGIMGRYSAWLHFKASSGNHCDSKCGRVDIKRDDHYFLRHFPSELAHPTFSAQSRRKRRPNERNMGQIRHPRTRLFVTAPCWGTARCCHWDFVRRRTAQTVYLDDDRHRFLERRTDDRRCAWSQCF